MSRVLSLIAIALCALAGTAAAQANPTFKFGDPEEVKEVKAVEWVGVAEAGLVVTTGNSRTRTITAAGKVTMLAAKNKLAFEAALAYARSTILVAADDDASGTIGADEIDEQSTTTANNWATKLRYDRFLTAHNSLYAAALAAADEPAGKNLVAGVQAGYSRQLYKTERHELVAEAGYDLSYEDLVVGDPVTIHSARVFAGYTGTIRTDTGVTVSVEGLANMNTLATEPESAQPLEDTRINAGAAITTKLAKVVSLTVSIGVKFDNQPSPRAPFALPYDTGFVPLSDRTDTLTKASLIVALF